MSKLKVNQAIQNAIEIEIAEANAKTSARAKFKAQKDINHERLEDLKFKRELEAINKDFQL